MLAGERNEMGSRLGIKRKAVQRIQEYIEGSSADRDYDPGSYPKRQVTPMYYAARIFKEITPEPI